MALEIRLRQFPIPPDSSNPIAYHATYVLYDNNVVVATINGGAMVPGHPEWGIITDLTTASPFYNYALGAWVMQGQGEPWASLSQGATEFTIYPPPNAPPDAPPVTDNDVQARWNVGVTAVQTLMERSWNGQFNTIFNDQLDIGWHYNVTPSFAMQGNSNSVAFAIGAAMFGDVYSASTFASWLPGTLFGNLGSNVDILSSRDINAFRPQNMPPIPSNWFERRGGSIETIDEGNIRKAMYTDEHTGLVYLTIYSKIDSGDIIKMDSPNYLEGGGTQR
jgi:hypothetical protein